MNPYLIAFLGVVAIVGTVVAIVAMFGKAKQATGEAGAKEKILENGAKLRKEAEDAAAAERKRLEELYK